MAWFVPLIAWGFTALAAAGVNVFGNQSSRPTHFTPSPGSTPNPSPGPRPVPPGTQQYTAPPGPAPIFTRGNFSITPASSGSGSPASPAPAPSPPPPPPPPPPPAPEPPAPEPGPPPVYTGVKAAPIDTVVFIDEPFDPNYYEDVLFQDFGGQELLAVARNDTVNGQNISYQPFRDLGIIRDQYSPNSLLSIQETSDRFFANFLIRLNEKIPGVGNGPDGTNVYLEDEGETGSIVIEFVNIEANEQVEIQILNAGIIEDIGI